MFAALLSLELRDVEGLREYVAELTAVLAEHETMQNQVGADVLGGYVAVLDGQEEAGISRIRRALDEPGGADHVPGMHALIVRLLLGVCEVAGESRTGLEAAERAIEMSGPVRVWEAESRRLRAEFLLLLDASTEDIEAELERALSVARRQGAKMFELRTAASLLRHRMERGDGPGTSEAHDLLAEIYDRLPEGRNTPDLREAATILAQF